MQRSGLIPKSATLGNGSIPFHWYVLCVWVCIWQGEEQHGRQACIPIVYILLLLFLEVVRIEDSVSSQFQPLSKIQTEAVLYISGHVNISHDDTQFAFR